ncbi:MAG: hypothetical protein LH465_08340 [Sphingomonas bacterium]|nr:hypothetical protein [Sphingomonas bacterium]
MRSLMLISTVALGLAACALPAPPPSAPPPEVAANAASALPTAALLDPYVGRYVSGGDAIVVRRTGNCLVAERGGQAPTPLTLVGLATFADLAGGAFLFDRAGGGGSTRLTLIAANGTRREWMR